MYNITEKITLCKSIGNFFGDYFEEDGKLCIDNGDQVFKYDTPDDLLKDWMETLIEHQNATDDTSGNWNNAIDFIQTEIIENS